MEDNGKRKQELEEKYADIEKNLEEIQSIEGLGGTEISDAEKQIRKNQTLAREIV